LGDELRTAAQVFVAEAKPERLDGSVSQQIPQSFTEA
jgi:hypothetical protein